MFDILVFVYEHCRQTDVSGDPDRVAKRLSAAGFESAEISAALTWLAGIVRAPQRAIARSASAGSTFRALAPRELAKLDVEACGFLMSMEQCGILSPHSRELVLERALATADSVLTVDQLKLIVLMVLWNQREPACRLVAEELRSSNRNRLPH